MAYTELDHLKEKDAIVKKIYNHLINELQKFGPITIEPKKTSIHLVNRFGFAGVYTRSNYINLEFQLSHKLGNKRISKIEQVSTNRFHHSTRLETEKDIDKELLSWLKEAYDLKK